MWLAVLFVAITGAGTVFMVCFLIALLRESALSKWYWAMPVAFENHGEPAHEDLETSVVVRVKHFTSMPMFMRFREAEIETLDEEYVPLGRRTRPKLWLSHIRKGGEVVRYHPHI